MLTLSRLFLINLEMKLRLDAKKSSLLHKHDRRPAGLASFTSSYEASLEFSSGTKLKCVSN